MSNPYPKWLLDIRAYVLKIFSKYSVPRWTVFAVDVLAVFTVFLVAYLLRFNFEINQIDHNKALVHGLLAMVVFAVFSLIYRPYSGLLRHTTLTDISLVFIVTSISSFCLILLSLISRNLISEEYFTIPISVILIHYVSITVLMFFSRVFVKLLFRFATSPTRNTRNVLIYGAGDLGFVVKRVVMSDLKDGFIVKGFIDTDKNLHGKKINGIPVFGETELTQEYLKKNKIESLILADEEMTIDEKSRIIHSAINLKLEVLETPEVDKWLNGQLNATQLQRVKLEDLLGRDPIELNMNKLRKGLNNKTILITGAAGSIGSEIVRQLSRFSCERVILVDQAETPLFYLEKEIKEKFIDLHFETVLADVTNKQKMELIFKEFLPEIVFHAAAYKHVSLMQENPHEAIRVNVGGTRVVTELALNYRVKKFVMISTDKSVNPTSIMGASKRICEKLVQSMAQKSEYDTQFIITRFGNVLGSNGSVIPLFTEQIRNGGPVTVTHPEVYRYFMTIPEACQLVLEAGFMGNGGEIFVFDMGEPVKIADLAENMILLSGFVPGQDIKITFTGLRPGEKLYEELLTDKETTIATHHPKIMKASVEKIQGDLILNEIEKLLKSLYSIPVWKIVRIIEDLVPEYNSANGDHPNLEKEKKIIPGEIENKE